MKRLRLITVLFCFHQVSLLLQFKNKNKTSNYSQNPTDYAILPTI